MDVVGDWDRGQEDSLQVAKAVDHGGKGHGALALVWNVNQLLVPNPVDPE